MIYTFNTTATMKPYNEKQWWIDSNYIREITVEADDIETALNEYKRIVEDKYCATISNNAIKNKRPMFIDDKNGETKQVGFVITGKTDFQDDSGSWSEQYIDLWVDVAILVSPFN